MEKPEQLKKLEALEAFVKEARVEAEKFYEKNVKSAGTKLRLKMQDIKSVAQEIRNDVTAAKNA